MDSNLGLKTHHEQSVREYLRFSRYKRGECLTSIGSSCDSLMESQLQEDTTFSTAEVCEMLSGMWSAVKTDLETELISFSHLSALLLQQLLHQADQVHLKMKVNVAELENKELLEGMATYEQQVLSESSTSLLSSISTRTQLEPLNFGGDNLLRKEIEKLTEENEKLKDRIKMLESKASSILKEKSLLKAELSQHSLPPKSDNSDLNSQEEVTKLREELVLLKASMSKSGDTKELEYTLIETKEKLLQVTGELERTKEELDKRFKDTAQFQTMKKLLETKNKQIQELRAKQKQ